MGILLSVLETALPVFVMLGMGMLCRSKSFLTRDGVDAIKKVVITPEAVEGGEPIIVRDPAHPRDKLSGRR